MVEPQTVMCKGCAKDSKMYVAGYCFNCYYKCSKSRLAFKCEHNTRTHYSKGYCRQCYISDYLKSKRELKNKSDAKLKD